MLNFIRNNPPSFAKSLVNRARYKYINSLYSGREYIYKTDNVFWWHGKNNFGDLITPYLYNKMTGKEPVLTIPSNDSTETVILGAGSIINWAKANTVVWGSGIMSRYLYMQKPNTILAVRGPVTQKRMIELGYDCPDIFGDPGLLLSEYYKSRSSKLYRLGIVPHYNDWSSVIASYGEKEDVLVIDVLRDVEAVIEDICSCEVIISSSLHGCIAAHSYGIPAVWCDFGGVKPGDDIKYIDYFCSMNMRQITEPLIVTQDCTVNNLLKVALNFPQPESPLVDLNKLRDCCPFFVSGT